MSGGPKGAKRPLERPLDEGVRRLWRNAAAVSAIKGTGSGDEHTCLFDLYGNAIDEPGEGQSYVITMMHTTMLAASQAHWNFD